MLDGTSVVELSVTSEAEQMLRIDMQKTPFQIVSKGLCTNTVTIKF